MVGDRQAVLTGLASPEKLISSRVGVHDSNHVELKLDYTKPAHQKRSRYRVEAYFFIPRSVGISPQTYPAAQFYGDIKANIRFKEPGLPLDALKGSEDAPLEDIAELLDAARANPHELGGHQQLVVEMKLFATVVRANVRDQVERMCQLLQRNDADGGESILADDVHEQGLRLLAQLRKLLKRYRRNRAKFLDGQLPRDLAESYQRIDEYLSLVTESHLTRFVEAVDGSGAAGRLTEVRALARELLVQERQHRVHADYPSIVADDDGSDDANEHFLYRRGLLKKYATSVLWLDIARSPEGRRLSQIGASIAAAAAMAFAVIATIYQSNFYGINSWPFVVAAVVTYILKDRIKDGLKAYFSSKLTGWLADYSVQIHDPISGQKIGRCREAFTYLADSDVPREVWQRRHPRAVATIEKESKPEVVLKYEKQIRLDGELFVRRLRQDHYEVNDIIRFDLTTFLSRTDDPSVSVPIYDDETDRVVPRAFPKVYHLNVVLVFHSSQDGAPVKRLKRARIVFDKRGIRRIEEP